MQKTDGRTVSPVKRAAVGAGVAGLLASAAVMGIGSTAAYGEDVPCGTPAREAVYTTIYHAALPAVYETVVTKEAWTDEEWAQESPGDGWVKHIEATRWVKTKDAVDAIPPVEEVSHTEYKYKKTVVTREHQDAVYEYIEHPAVYETEYRYRKQEKRKVWILFPIIWDWEYYYIYDWKTNNTSQGHGWELTGETRNGKLIKDGWTEEVLVSPEVPELTEDVYEWFETDPGAPWVATGKSKKIVDQEYVPGTPGSDEEGYWEFKWLLHHDAVTEERLVKAAVPAYTSTVLVTPATPAGPPCEDDTPPAQPSDRIEATMDSDVDCEEGVVTETTTTTTTEYVWDEVAKAWELGEPVVTTATDERAATAAECPAPTPVEEEDDDEVAGVEAERPKPTTKPVNAVDEVLGVEKSVAVPTAVNAGLGGAIVQGSQGNVAGEAMLGGSGLMLLLAGWMRFGRREHGGNEA